METPAPVRAFHHVAYRCSDSGATRRFYEDFLGLPLAEAFVIEQTKTGRATSVLHSFYRLGDGTFLAFFEVPDSPFPFKAQHDFDLHVAMEVAPEALATGGGRRKTHARGESLEMGWLLEYHVRTSATRRSSASVAPAAVLGAREGERLAQAAQLLRKAEREVRVLRTVAWSPEVVQRFFEAGARELPAVTYQAPDPSPVLSDVAAARRLIESLLKLELAGN